MICGLRPIELQTVSSISKAFDRCNILQTIAQGSDLGARYVLFNNLLSSEKTESAFKMTSSIRSAFHSLRDLYADVTVASSSPVVVPLEELAVIGLIATLNRISSYQPFVLSVLREKPGTFESTVERVLAFEKQLEVLGQVPIPSSFVAQGVITDDNPRKLKYFCKSVGKNGRGCGWNQSHEETRCYRQHPELAPKSNRSFNRVDMKAMLTDVIREMAENDTLDLNKSRKHYPIVADCPVGVRTALNTSIVKSFIDKMSFLLGNTTHRHGVHGVKKWIVDSGCTDSMTKSQILENVRQMKTRIQTANSIMKSSHVGDVPLLQNGVIKTTLNNVLYCPDIAENLISVSQLADQGYTITFNSLGWKASKDALHKEGDLSGPREGNLYVYSPDGLSTESYASKAVPKFVTLLNDPTVEMKIKDGRWIATSQTNGSNYEGKIDTLDLLLALKKRNSTQVDLALDWHCRLGH